MSRSTTEDAGSVQQRDDSRAIDEVDPRFEPEAVGHFSAIDRESCGYLEGETVDDVEACGDEATHTAVLYDGAGLVMIAVCDEHGDPDDVVDDREWSGELRRSR